MVEQEDEPPAAAAELVADDDVGHAPNASPRPPRPITFRSPRRSSTVSRSNARP
jgi:hypothetical protein